MVKNFGCMLWRPTCPQVGLCCGPAAAVEMSLWAHMFEYLHSLQLLTDLEGCGPLEAELPSSLCFLTADTM